MLTAAVKSILRPKYNGRFVYIHNLSNFDGVFLLNILAKINNFQLKVLKKR